MLILLLSAPFVRHLEFAVGKSERLMVAETWSELERMLQVYPASVAFVHPTRDVASVTDFARINAAFPSLPIVVYVPFTPIAFQIVCELSRSGLRHVLLYSHDDSVDEIIATISKLRSNPIAERFVSRLRPRLVRLPNAIETTVQTMFAQPYRFHNAQDLATSAHVSIVGLYRAFHTAKFRAPKKMVVAARLLRVYAHLTDPGQSVSGVAEKLSYRSAQVLACHTHEVFGVCPSRLRDAFTEESVFDTLLSWILETEPGRHSYRAH